MKNFKQLNQVLRTYELSRFLNERKGKPAYESMPEIANFSRNMSLYALGVFRKLKVSIYFAEKSEV